MEGNMTVFGFGRQSRCCGKYLTAEKSAFSIGLVESKEHAEVAKAVGRAVRGRE
jgi:hypothetical protein